MIRGVKRSTYLLHRYWLRSDPATGSSVWRGRRNAREGVDAPDAGDRDAWQQPCDVQPLNLPASYFRNGRRKLRSGAPNRGIRTRDRLASLRMTEGNTRIDADSLCRDIHKSA
jgi:hypothetical protein